ncbi:hypothetical protein ACJX0J_011463, partial [Zea mays]
KISTSPVTSALSLVLEGKIIACAKLFLPGFLTLKLMMTSFGFSLTSAFLKEQENILSLRDSIASMLSLPTSFAGQKPRGSTSHGTSLVIYSCLIAMIVGDPTLKEDIASWLLNLGLFFF